MLLPDHDKDSVERMISWLYTKKFELTVPVSVETSAECYMQLAKLNTLADMYDIYLLQNRIVDELYDLTKPPKDVKPPQLPVITYVYDNTTGGSSFRKLLVAWYAYSINFEWYDKKTTRDALAKVSHEFAIDLALALGTRQKYPDRKSSFNLPSSVFYETPPKEGDKTPR